MKITDNNYYTIHGWMITELNLKGIDLSVYAIIYGFSQDGESEFRGSIQYLCDFCGGVSRPTIINALKRLTESELIIKTTDVLNGVTLNRYKISLHPVKNFYGGSKEILPGGSKEILPNKEYKDLKNIIKEKEFASEKMQAAFESWLQYKLEKREPYKKTGRNALVTKLKNQIAQYGENAVIESINNSMANGWKGIYISEPKKQKVYDTNRPASYDLDQAIKKAEYEVPKLKKKEKREKEIIK